MSADTNNNYDPAEAQIERFKALTAHIVPTPEQVDRIANLRASFAGLVEVIGEEIPASSRERSLALTHLENARMYAVFAIVSEGR